MFIGGRFYEINEESMTPENFCYWLQGFFEIKKVIPGTNTISISDEQSKMIEEHLKMVFKIKQLKETTSLQIQPFPSQSLQGTTQRAFLDQITRC